MTRNEGVLLRRQTVLMQLASLRGRVQADPWDAEAWKLLSAAASKQPSDVQKSIYEDLLGRFPTAVSHFPTPMRLQQL